MQSEKPPNMARTLVGLPDSTPESYFDYLEAVLDATERGEGGDGVRTLTRKLKTADGYVLYELKIYAKKDEGFSERIFRVLKKLGEGYVPPGTKCATCELGTPVPDLTPDQARAVRDFVRREGAYFPEGTS